MQYVVLPAEPGWTYIKFSKKGPVIAWAVEVAEDGSVGRPIPVGPWGKEFGPYSIIAPDGRTYEIGPEISEEELGSPNSVWEKS